MTRRAPARKPVEASMSALADEPLVRTDPAREPSAPTLPKPIEAELARFEAVLEQMPFAVVLAEAPGGRVVFANAAAERMYGAPLRRPASIDQYPSAAAVHRDGSPYSISEYPIARALTGSSVTGEEMDIVRHDGTRCPVIVSAGPVRDQHGRIVAAIGTFYDVTKIRETEREHRDLARRQHAARVEAEAAHARFALLAEISQFLLASLDYQAAITGLTRLVLPALGDACFIDLDEPDDGHRLAIAHINPHKAELLEKLNRADGLTRLVGRAVSTALRTGRPERGDRVGSSTRQDGAASDEIISAIDPRAYMVIPLVARGRVLGAMVFLVTESDRKYSGDDLDFAQHVARRAATAVDNLRLYEETRQARAAAEDANRLKDEFLATLSHELRTPLNAILGWARMLRSRSLDEMTEDKALGTIERNALAQARIVEDLLDVSRVITGGLRLNLQQVDFGHLIDAAITAVRPAAEAKGILLESRLARVEPMVGDPGRLQQIVWNLVSNATKFTPPGGRIEVKLDHDHAEAVLRVRDTGAGISAEFLPHVFERFRQADSTSSRVHGGLGLGLAIVRHLVELHGGTVDAESAGSGKGATFTVRIPIRSAMRRAEDRHGAPAAAGAPPAAAVANELDGVSVLIVDDEPDARELFAAILTQHGAAVRTAASAGDAIESLETFQVRVLIADIGMSGEDGYSLIRRIRAGNMDVSAVALTAYARHDDRRRAFDAGYDRHLAKPVDPADLVSTVADLAGR